PERAGGNLHPDRALRGGEPVLRRRAGRAAARRAAAGSGRSAAGGGCGGRMRGLGAGGPLMLAALLAACGGRRAPDLFIVQRSGNVAGARLTLLVNEEGGVHCNGGRALKLSDPQLIEARSIQEDLREPASKHTSLPAGSQSVLSYYVRD